MAKKITLQQNESRTDVFDTTLARDKVNQKSLPNFPFKLFEELEYDFAFLSKLVAAWNRKDGYFFSWLTKQESKIFEEDKFKIEAVIDLESNASAKTIINNFDVVQRLFSFGITHLRIVDSNRRKIGILNSLQMLETSGGINEFNITEISNVWLRGKLRDNLGMVALLEEKTYPSIMWDLLIPRKEFRRNPGDIIEESCQSKDTTEEKLWIIILGLYRIEDAHKSYSFLKNVDQIKDITKLQSIENFSKLVDILVSFHNFEYKWDPEDFDKAIVLKCGDLTKSEDPVEHQKKVLAIYEEAPYQVGKISQFLTILEDAVEQKNLTLEELKGGICKILKLEFQEELLFISESRAVIWSPLYYLRNRLNSIDQIRAVPELFRKIKPISNDFIPSMDVSHSFYDPMTAFRKIFDDLSRYNVEFHFEHLIEINTLWDNMEKEVSSENFPSVFSASVVKAAWFFDWDSKEPQNAIYAQFFKEMTKLAKDVGKEAEKKSNELLLKHFFDAFVATFLSRKKDPQKYPLKKLLPLGKKVARWCNVRGATKVTCESFGKLSNMFEAFGLELIDSLIEPTQKSQTDSLHACLHIYSNLFGMEAIISEEDLTTLAAVSKAVPFRGHDTLNYLVYDGIKSKVIQKPISKEGKILVSFVKQCPVHTIELYQSFKNVIKSDHKNLKPEIVAPFFKDVRKLQKEIFEGHLASEPPEDTFLALLYATFPPTFMSHTRKLFNEIYKTREGRQQDMPSEALLLDKKTINIKKANTRVEGQLDITPWNVLGEIVKEIQKPFSGDIGELGLTLLKAYTTKEIESEQVRKEFLQRIYGLRIKKGTPLPSLVEEVSILEQYAMFIGDEMQTLLLEIFEKSMNKDAKQYTLLKNAILGKKKKGKGLDKQLRGILKGKQSPEKKLEILNRVMQRNNFPLVSLEELEKLNDDQAIQEWVAGLGGGSIEKELIDKMLFAIHGKEHKKMLEELRNLEDESEKGNILLTLRTSKERLHGSGMFAMGVCVAVDNELWNKEDFWQILFFTEQFICAGGLLFRTIKEDGKKYLIVSFQPSNTLVGTANKKDLFDKLLKVAKDLEKKLKYDRLLIPAAKIIQANAPSMQEEIANKKFRPFSLKNEYAFSYHKQYNYKYKERAKAAKLDHEFLLAA